MISDNCFCPLIHLPLLDQATVSEAFGATYIDPKKDTAENRIAQTIKADTTFINTKFCKDLSLKFGKVTAKYMRFDPLSYYDWHTDLNRGCAINFLLNLVPDTVTLFGSREDRINLDIIPVPYVLYQPTLFNTKISHCVINYSQQTRYIMTIGIHEPSFADAKKFLLDYNTDKY
jgi:hypothetical protein